ncbi:MAG: FHA domain-containing protein, partial [Chloroflexi bacterium]|nr:FHA domain-containing protein [Chloroflexota bacterium]
LSPFRALELGVSRMHATLTINGTSLTLTDLGSTNGSMVNSVKLQPNAPFQLNDGDEIRLGKLALRVYFEPGQTG